MSERLKELTKALMLIPGLSGHEGRVRRRIAAELDGIGLGHRADRLGNLIATLEGDAAAPSVLLIAHMDQLGLLVRRIEPEGFLRVERLGGVPEKALPAQAVAVTTRDGVDLPGVITNTAHHFTPPDQKYRVTPYPELYVDCGFASAEEARAAGVEIGAPITYAPRAIELAGGRLAGAAIDDRAGCAVLVELMRALKELPGTPTVHALFSVQEEFNLRGALPAAQALKPDVCIQLDLAVATDTPDLAGRGEIRLGGGPAMAVFSFHGRGTLNGLLPHPSLVRLVEETARREGLPLQRATHMGALTETSYVQLVGEGVACVDLGFPCRSSHSALEICDLSDLAQLLALLRAAILRIGPGFSLDPDDHLKG